MRQFGYFETIYKSFYSRDLYRDVAANWGAGIFLYLLLLLAICWAALMFRIQPMINAGAATFADLVVVQLPPTMTIKDGILTTTENRPYLIRNPQEKVIAIIDTSGQYTDITQTDAQWLVTKDTMVSIDRKESKVTTQKIPSSASSFTIIPTQAKAATLKYIGWLWVVLFPLVLLGVFIYRIIVSFLYAILGKMIAAVSGVTLTFADVFTLAVVALTPSVVINTIVWLINFGGLRYHFWIFFIISLLYLIFAINSNRPTSTPLAKV